MIDNIELVSGVEYSDSVVYIWYIYNVYIYIVYIDIFLHMCIYSSFFRFFSVIDYYKILSIVPYAI